MPSNRRAAASLAAAVLLTAAAGPSRQERALTRDLDRLFNAPVMEQGLWGV